MKQVDEIIYDAIQADAALMESIGGHVVSTCFEVSPDEADNTTLPNIIVTDDGFQNQDVTKDSVWEGDEDKVQSTVDIAAASPNEVKQIVRMVRRAVSRYIVQMYQNGEETPELENLASEGLQWDWMRPCYYQKLTYQCSTKSTTDDEQD